MISKTRYVSCIATGGIVAVVLSALFLAGAFTGLQQQAHDPIYGGKQPILNVLILAVDDRSLQEIGRWPWNRTVFADLLSHLSTARAVGFDVMFAEPTSDDAALANAIYRQGRVILPIEYGSFDQENGKVIGRNQVSPLPILQGNANELGLGIINVITDEDGITRAVNSHIDTTYPLLAQALASTITSKEIPHQDRLLINFIGPPGSFQTIPITHVLHHRINENVFNGSLVLIGATAPDLHDSYFVPTSHGIKMPGVEVHANLLQTILLNSYLSVEPSWLLVAVIFILSLAVSLLIARFHAWTAAAGSSLLLVIYILFAAMVFEHQTVIDLVFAPLTIVLGYIANLVNLFITEKRHKKQIFDAFNKYVSPTVIEELLKNPEKLKLGGEKRTITIFFSDIRGFTSVSEKLSPEALVDLLNEYLSAMTDIVMDNEGVIDKYMGDAIMAFWGAPLDQPDHAVRACTASLSMMEKLHILQAKWEKDNVPALDIGIGLNTGHAVVGNMGSDKRFDYTCMGDTVNLGSRLEGLNKEYGTNIIVSESTRKALASGASDSKMNNSIGFVLRELDAVRVKGKKEPVTIYELAGRKETIPPEKERAIALFETGLQHYRKQEFHKAMEIFEQAVRDARDKTSHIYIERCRYFIEHPPGKDWDKVWVMKTK